MSLITRLYRGETAFDFVSQRQRWFIVSGVLILISILSLAVRGLDRSVDFTGGTIVEAPNVAGLDVAEYRDALESVDQSGARVQLLTPEGVGDDTPRVRVQTESLDADAQDELVNAVAEAAGVTFDDTEVDAVGPTFGAEITRRAIEALVVFLVVVVLFISWRFEWKMALGAIAALFHDLIITAGIYSVVGFEVTPATVIAVLTILGYSLYDTVVVFDKIKENIDELGTKNTFGEIANLSLNQVLMRSINTSLTSLLPIGSLLFVGSFLLGATTLREFALALFIGVGIGTYSSIFVATPLLTLWKGREAHWERMERRAARRDDTPLEAATVGAAVATAVEVRDSGATPRAPKNRKKRR
jgi:preprotein translocase subunit SecF